MAEDIPIMGIRLRKTGEYTVVDAEIGGDWIEVIRERSDVEFSHIVEADGMWAAYYTLPHDLLESGPAPSSGVKRATENRT